jgi:hypothetical protein
VQNRNVADAVKETRREAEPGAHVLDGFGLLLGASGDYGSPMVADAGPPVAVIAIKPVGD